MKKLLSTFVLSFAVIGILSVSSFADNKGDVAEGKTQYQIHSLEASGYFFSKAPGS